MSAVIPFPTSRTRPLRETAPSGPAEVVIFPGVRIERIEFDLAERLPMSRRNASRKPQGRELDAC